MELKVDTVELPVFDGNLSKWQEFKEFFLVLIDRQTFPDSIKLYQLRKHVTGKAFDTIKGYQSTGENYQAAWNDLVRRFERRKETVQEYIRKFLEIPPTFSRAFYHRLQQMIDDTNQMIRALPNLGVDITNWDPFIVLILMVKLDDDTKARWRELTGRNEVTSVTQLIEFLEQRSNNLRPNQSDRLSTLLRGEGGRKGPKRVFQVTDGKDKEKKPKKDGESGSCPVCKGPHKVWNCEKLLKKCAEVRTDIIRTLKICFKCLLKHQIGLCEADDCAYCGGPHNILLCFKKERDDRKIAKREVQHNLAGQSDQSSAKKEKKQIQFNEFSDEEDPFQPSTSAAVVKKNSKK